MDDEDVKEIDEDAPIYGEDPNWTPEDVDEAYIKLGDDCGDKKQATNLGYYSTILDKINGTSGPPLPPISMMTKWHAFAPSRLQRGWGIIVPFYTVQDGLRRPLKLQEAMFAMQITSDLLSHAR